MILQHLEQNPSVHLYGKSCYYGSLVMDSFRTFVRLINLLCCFYSIISPALLKTFLKEPHSFFFSEESLYFSIITGGN